MNPVAGFLFSVIICAGIYINKYVLSILGFRYPTIFQGWQTLTGLIIYKLLTFLSKSGFQLTGMDRAAAISLLPGFLFHTTSIIAGSKALAGLPIPVCVSVWNTLPAWLYLLDRLLPGGRPGLGPLQLAAAAITAATGALLVLTQAGLEFSDSAYFWLVVGVVCSLAHCLHCRIADARYGSWDRLYYNSIFSVIVLAPASFYLEEAFEALNFHHDRQELFLAGCLASAMLGAAANLYTVRLKQDESFGPVQHLALAVTALLSPTLFSTQLSSFQWSLVVTNVISAIPIPSHISPDEEDLGNLPSIITEF